MGKFKGKGKAAGGNGKKKNQGQQARKKEPVREVRREEAREEVQQVKTEVKTVKTEKKVVKDWGLWGILGIMLAFGVYGAMSFKIAKVVNGVQPSPYMDEEFHIPQCQRYCRGEYDKWDPKITTLPGTYIVSTAVLGFLNIFIPFEDHCSTFMLRSFNLAVSGFNMVMIFCILGHYSEGMSTAKRAFAALNIATVPILYFFSFMYYTDAVSTAFLLLMHYFFINGRCGLSAMAGGFSVIARQTNVIWVFYHGVLSVLRVLTSRYGEDLYLSPSEYRKLLINAHMPAAKRGKRGKSSAQRSTPTWPPVDLASIQRIWDECGDEFNNHAFPFVFVGLSFVAFVIYNGSIVVGDKAAHQATLNVPQVGYFSMVFAGFAVPFVLTRSMAIYRNLSEHPRIVFTACVLFGIAVIFNTVAHPYLLADNRHFTFYIWQRFIQYSPCFRYIWIPFYVSAWALILGEMGIPKVCTYVYVVCVALNLAPQLLMEFRYFIPAYLFARLTFRDVSWLELILEFLNIQFWNFVSVYVFAYYPIHAPNKDELERIMW